MSDITRLGENRTVAGEVVEIYMTLKEKVYCGEAQNLNTGGFLKRANKFHTLYITWNSASEVDKLTTVTSNATSDLDLEHELFKHSSPYQGHQ